MSTTSVISMPSLIQRDTYQAAADKRLEILKKSRFPWNPFKTRVQPVKSPSLVESEATVSERASEQYPDQTIYLSKYPYPDGPAEDLMTLFSIPYYSHRSLLPSDPSPFTTPDAINCQRHHQPDVSLTQYPLPDGNFKWVSSTWMIDMRSDSGEVQHDGFEYNWLFRQHKWRAQVGKLNAGGWVRRRRWVRLMMRPAQKSFQVENSEVSTGTDSPVTSWSSPPSVIALDTSNNQLSENDVWQDGTVEANWARCHLVMRRLGRDGLKIELWEKWLGPSSDDEAPKTEFMAPVLRVYGKTILHSFIYPDSRAQFLLMLGRSSLLAEMNIGLTGELDFFSYVTETGSTSTPRENPESAQD